MKRLVDIESASKKPLETHQKMRIIVGAAENNYEGWIATDKHALNLVREADWAFHFKPNTVDAILAEHVWEHLDARDAVLATQNCFKYLAPGGYIRVAVPDGFHPDENYINYVKPSGWGAGSEDHHVLYTYHTLKAVFASTGFDVTLLEYFDERGTFHYQEWSPADGMIMRSKRFDERNRTRELSYTSIILDAKKPAMIDRAGRGRNYTSTFPAQNSIIPQYTNTSFMVTITEKWRDLLARGSRFVALE